MLLLTLRRHLTQQLPPSPRAYASLPSSGPFVQTGSSSAEASGRGRSPGHCTQSSDRAPPASAQPQPAAPPPQAKHGKLVKGPSRHSGAEACANCPPRLQQRQTHTHTHTHAAVNSILLPSMRRERGRTSYDRERWVRFTLFSHVILSTGQ